MSWLEKRKWHHFLAVVLTPARLSTS